MSYEKQTILTGDRNPNGGTDYEVPEFMVGEDVALEWESGLSEYGSNSNTLRPAYQAAYGGRCWLHSWQWFAAQGYKAEGYGSKLVAFEKGVAILVDHGVYAFPVPSSSNH